MNIDIMFKIIQKQVFFFLMILTVFILPLSISLRSIILSIATATLCIYLPFFLNLKQMLHKPWAKALFLFFFVIVLSAFLGNSDWNNKLSIIHKYAKLLYIPLIALAFQDKDWMKPAVIAFILAMLVTLICSFLYLQNLPYISPRAPDGIFHNHITTGYFMAFAAFFSAIYAKKSSGFSRLAYLILSVLFSLNTLFINSGRTGYVTYIILLLVFTFYYIPLRKLPLYLFIILSLFGFIAFKSPTFNSGVIKVYHEIQEFKTGNKSTSVGFRLQFHNFAKHLFLSSPVWGVGTGGFSTQFTKENPIPEWGNKLLDPHNQYWLIAAENGVIGLIALLYFFFCLFNSVLKLQEYRLILFGILTTFVMANFFDSFLLLSGPGYFFVLFVGICLSEESTTAKTENKIGMVPC